MAIGLAMRRPRPGLFDQLDALVTEMNPRPSPATRTPLGPRRQVPWRDPAGLRDMIGCSVPGRDVDPVPTALAAGDRDDLRRPPAIPDRHARRCQACAPGRASCAGRDPEPYRFGVGRVMRVLKSAEDRLAANGRRRVDLPAISAGCARMDRDGARARRPVSRGGFGIGRAIARALAATAALSRASTRWRDGDGDGRMLTRRAAAIAVTADVTVAAQVDAAVRPGPSGARRSTSSSITPASAGSARSRR